MPDETPAKKNHRSFINLKSKTHARLPVTLFLLLVVAAAIAPQVRADEPFARSRDYDLRNARIELRFDLDQRQVIGQVTHTLTTLKDGLRELDFDSVGLKILSARLDGQEAHFSTDDAKLRVDLGRTGKAGEKHEVVIRYQGTPKKGLYFILPNKGDSTQPKEIWTQGEAEDTRYYVPIYDYPNDRTTTEMIVTVPPDSMTPSQRTLATGPHADPGTTTRTMPQSEPLPPCAKSREPGQFARTAKS